MSTRFVRTTKYPLSLEHDNLPILSFIDLWKTQPRHLQTIILDALNKSVKKSTKSLCNAIYNNVFARIYKAEVLVPPLYAFADHHNVSMHYNVLVFNICTVTVISFYLYVYDRTTYNSISKLALCKLFPSRDLTLVYMSKHSSASFILSNRNTDYFYLCDIDIDCQIKYTRFNYDPTTCCRFTDDHIGNASYAVITSIMEKSRKRDAKYVAACQPPDHEHSIVINVGMTDPFPRAKKYAGKVVECGRFNPVQRSPISRYLLKIVDDDVTIIEACSRCHSKNIVYSNYFGEILIEISGESLTITTNDGNIYRFTIDKDRWITRLSHCELGDVIHFMSSTGKHMLFRITSHGIIYHRKLYIELPNSPIYNIEHVVYYSEQYILYNTKSGTLVLLIFVGDGYYIYRLREDYYFLECRDDYLYFARSGACYNEQIIEKKMILKSIHPISDITRFIG
jgi:hypothetical protein